MRPQYKLLSAGEPAVLERKMNEAVAEGYEPHMGIAIGPSMYRPPMILQWVVRWVDVDALQLEEVNGQAAKSDWVVAGLITP